MSGPGFCSVAELAPGDLGTPLAADRTPAHIAALLRVAAKSVKQAVAETKQQKQPATPIAMTPAAQVWRVQYLVHAERSVAYIWLDLIHSDGMRAL